MISILIGALLACALAAVAQGQTTATVSGYLSCVSNGEDNNIPSPNPCVEGNLVDPAIGTGSYFTLEFTLPNTDQPPTDTTPPLFLSQTTYLVSPDSGEFGLTATIGGILFPSNVDTLPFPGSGNLRVTVTNDETFGVFPPPGIDQWSVSSFGNTDVIPVPAGAFAVVCSLEINGPSTQIVSNSYFVPLSLAGAGWFFPGGAFIRCDVIAPNPEFDDTLPQSPENFPIVIQQVLTGLVSDYDTIQPQMVDIDLKPGSDPNCINPNAGGRTSVAILSSENFDAQSVDTETLKFAGASASQCGLEDIKPKDGMLDLACRYKVRDVDWSPAGEDCGDVTLTGKLHDDETEIEGSALACIAGGATCEAGRR
jgi:hypothetical protein